MNDSDRQAIAGLFDKLGQVERQAPPRDADAEAFINHQIGQQPGAPYFMAQTIVMQDYALQQAQARIQQLEAEAAEAAQQAPAQGGGGGLFGGLFGSSSQPAPRRGSVPSMPRAGIGAGAGTGAPGIGAAGMGAAPMGQSPAQGGATWGPNAQAAGAPGMAPGMAQRPGFGGGGFLAGAAQTAMGVAGGVLLGNALMGMFGGSEAQAAEAPAADQAPEPSAADDQPADEPAAAEDDGGWFGGGGGDWFGGGSDEI